MSRKKQNISYIKPDEPAFLKRLKEEAGFVEGPTVDSKHEHLAVSDDEEEDDLDWGTVVVLKPGDLTAEQAREEKRKQDADKETEPADLSQKIVFKVPPKKRAAAVSDETDVTRVENSPVVAVKKAKKVENKKKAHLLSFDNEDPETDE